MTDIREGIYTDAINRAAMLALAMSVRPDLESAFLALTADEGLGSDADRLAGGRTTGGAA